MEAAVPPLAGDPAGARTGPQVPPGSTPAAAPPAASPPLARPSRPAPPQQQNTLPAVKDFLQKAFETVQRSQMEVLAQNSLQRALAAHAQLSYHRAMATQPRPQVGAPFPYLRQGAVAPEPPRSVAAPEPRPAAPPPEDDAAQPERPAAPTPTAGLFGPAPRARPVFPGYAMYNRVWMPPPRQRGPAPPRPVLVPKTPNPADPAATEAPKAVAAEKAPVSVNSSASEPSSLSKPEAVNGSRPVGNPEATSGPVGKAEAGSKPPAKPEVHSKPSGTPRSTRSIERTPKGDPIHCTSRVVETYQAFKASQRNRAAQIQSAPTSKKGDIPKLTTETSKKAGTPKPSAETPKKDDASNQSVETPKNDDVKTSAEALKNDTPKTSVETPKNDTLKSFAEAPKNVAPKPSAEISKNDVPKPSTEATKNDSPKLSTEASKKDTKKTSAETPKNDALKPLAEAPKNDVSKPSAVIPKNDAPKTSAASAIKAGAPQSSTQSPKRGAAGQFLKKGAPQSPRKGALQSPKKGAGQSPKKDRPPRDPPKDLDDDVDPKRRVLVSGFPPYTLPADLARVMARFGACIVERCRNRLAVVTFEAETGARAALAAPADLSLYGDFIEVKPFTSPAHVEELFRAYKKIIAIDKGQDIIMPTKIDLSGDFHQQLENVENAIRLTREQVQGVASLYVDLERVLQEEWPGCVAIPFGSIPAGLGIASSDADCYVELPAALRTRGGAAAFVTRARRLLAQYPRVFTQLVAIPRANTPIVKFRHAPSGFHCDVSSKTPLGAQNSRLIKLLLEHDARLPRVAVLLKYWAKVHGLSGTGRLTNYALTMMVLFYLQQPHVALVPAVERLQREPASQLLVDHWNAGFAPRRLPGPPNAASLAELLGGFFAFYAAFDFDALVVCPLLGVALRKAAFEAPDALPPELARYAHNVRANLAGPIRHAAPFCVQDPFELSHNVASSVSARLAADIRAFVALAADAFAAERGAGCPSLLRTLLLARPRLRRDRSAPCTKLVLIPRLRPALPAASWRARVRRLLLDVIFDDMLRLRLAREPEPEAPERRERPGVDREKYSGAAAKPVWRRKRNYSANAPEAADALVARQAAATDEIVRTAPDTPMHFEIELGFRDEPRQLHLFARLLEGEVDWFRQFVVFLHTVMFDWFRILLRLDPTPTDAGTGAETDLLLAEAEDEPEPPDTGREEAEN